MGREGLLLNVVYHGALECSNELVPPEQPHRPSGRHHLLSLKSFGAHDHDHDDHDGYHADSEEGGDEEHISFCGTPSPNEPLLIRNNARLEAWRLARGGAGRRNLLEDATCTRCISIDVYFNIFRSGSQGNVPSSVISTQMTYLNQAFSDTPFRFVRKDTDWINSARFYNNLLSSSTFGDYQVTYRRGGYRALNVYLGNIIDENNNNPGSVILGLNPVLPFELDEGSGALDGVLLNSVHALPGTGNRLGATLVHEVGHWLGLFHTFGNHDKGSCSGPGDYVDDTPNMRQSLYYPPGGCPMSQSSCAPYNVYDPVTNFMDYRDDSCYEEFSPGQIQRMYDHWFLYRVQDEVCSGSNSFLFEVTVRFDDYPHETYWKLMQGSNVVVRSDEWQNEFESNGAPIYDNTPQGHLRVLDRCIPGGSYRFDFGDTYSDGLFGNGFYEVTVDNTVVASGSSNDGYFAVQSTPFQTSSSSPVPRPTPLPAPRPTPSPIPRPTPAPVPAPTRDPTPSPVPRPTPSPTSPTPPGFWSACSPTFPCWECYGDCDTDFDCFGYLVCYQRDGYSSVPGCIGTGISDADYCVDPWYL